MAGTELCPSCVHRDVIPEASTKFANQPPLTSDFIVGNTRYTVNRTTDPEVRSEMIHDPKAAVDTMTAYLEKNPCQFEITGRCAAANFAVEQFFQKPL